MKTNIILTLALLSLTTQVCGQSPYAYRNKGMTFGAIVGALSGAAIGEHNDEPLAGAAIGTAVGALAGAAIGDSVDNDIAYDQMRRQQHTQQQLAYAATMQQVVSMSQAGLADHVIITHIQTNGVTHRLQPSDLILMKQAGVRDSVIQAMQTARLATAPPPAPRPVYREPVVVERHHYVVPRVAYPAYPPYRYPCPPPYRHHHPQNSVHWGITIGR